MAGTGIVVDHKATGVRYAVSSSNYNPSVHKYVRDLKPGETVIGFRPLARESIEDAVEKKTTGPATADAKDK